MTFPPSTPPRSHFHIHQNLYLFFLFPNRIQKTHLNDNNNNNKDENTQPEETKPK